MSEVICGYCLEYWEARELMPLLDYDKWSNFDGVVIEKAKVACINSGQTVANHFADVGKMVKIGSSTDREIKDYKLSRYACYLIAQNGDPSKEAIARAQTYFAVQARRQEILDELEEGEKRLFIRGEVSEQNKRLFSTAKTAGVSRFGLFNDAGYRGLYGKSLAEIEKGKGIKKGELLDRAGSVELAANLFRITQTDEKLKKENIRGEREATNTHNMVGGKVRQTIKNIGGVLPEDLAPEKHIKEIIKELKQLGASELKKVPEDTRTSKNKAPELFIVELSKEIDSAGLMQLNQYFKKHPGNIPVVIDITSSNKVTKRMRLAIGVTVSSELVAEVESLHCKVLLV